MTTIWIQNIYLEYDYSLEFQEKINTMVQKEINLAFSSFGDSGINRYNSTLTEYKTKEQFETTIYKMDGKLFGGTNLKISFW